MNRPSAPTPERPNLDALIERARELPPMTPEQRREQAVSFAYGNAAIYDPRAKKEDFYRAYDEGHPTTLAVSVDPLAGYAAVREDELVRMVGCVCHAPSECVPARRCIYPERSSR